MIDSFKGGHAFLSNFHHHPMDDPGLGEDFPTVEHYFQYRKTLNRQQALDVLAAATPSLAKARGRKVDLRPDWEAVKLLVMRDALVLKFAQGSELAERLTATHPHALVEGNHWGDRFWGVDGWGRNWLGILLMARRAELMDGVS